MRFNVGTQYPLRKLLVKFNLVPNLRDTADFYFEILLAEKELLLLLLLWHSDTSIKLQDHFFFDPRTLS